MPALLELREAHEPAVRTENHEVRAPAEVLPPDVVPVPGMEGGGEVERVGQRIPLRMEADKPLLCRDDRGLHRFPCLTCLEADGYHSSPCILWSLGLASEWAMTCRAGRGAQTGPRMSHCAGRDRLLPIAPAVIKDPGDLIEKPLHLLGLHHSSAIAVAAVIGLVLGVGLILLMRRRTLLR